MTKTLPVTLTTAAAEHAAGDVLGGKIEFENAGRSDGGAGVAGPLVIVDDSGSDVELELWLFNSEPTAINDDAAFAPTEADLHDLAGVISTSGKSWMAAGTPSVITVEDRFVPYQISSGRSLWGYLVTRGAITPAATDDITVILPVQLD
jgi:hypothetical protein